MSNIQYGITTGSDSQIRTTARFTGEDLSEFPSFNNRMVVKLAAKGITLPSSEASPFHETNAYLYASTPQEQIPIVALTPAQIRDGFVIGDLPLQGPNLVKFRKARQENDCLKNYALETLHDELECGKPAWCIAHSGFILRDFSKMYWDLRNFCTETTSTTMFAFAMKSINLILSDAAKLSPLDIYHKQAQHDTEFATLAKIITKPTPVPPAIPMTDAEFMSFQMNAFAKRKLFEKFATILITSKATDKPFIQSFLHRTIDTSMAKWETFDITQFEALFIASVKTHAMTSHSSEIISDAKLKAQIKSLSQNLASLQRKFGDKRKLDVNVSTTSTNSNIKSKKQTYSAKTCTFCGESGHVANGCFSNPNAHDNSKKKAKEFLKRNPSWKPKPQLPSYSVDANVTTVLHIEADPALAGLSEEGKILLKQLILLDGGSDQCILNKFYHHLFHRLTPLTYKCQLSGIGGVVNLDITHSGSITFMGCVIENVYYCALLSKSILSEPVLCRNYNFRISKEGIHCNITNLITSFSSTVQLGKVGEVGSGHYLLPITLFHHSPH